MACTARRHEMRRGRTRRAAPRSATGLPRFSSDQDVVFAFLFLISFKAFNYSICPRIWRPPLWQGAMGVSLCRLLLQQQFHFQVVQWSLNGRSHGLTAASVLSSCTAMARPQKRWLLECTVPAMPATPCIQASQDTGQHFLSMLISESSKV